MKYKYYNKRGDLIAESNSEIKFNEKLYPIFSDIKPVIEAKSNFYNKSEEDKK